MCGGASAGRRVIHAAEEAGGLECPLEEERLEERLDLRGRRPPLIIGALGSAAWVASCCLELIDVFILRFFIGLI